MLSAYAALGIDVSERASKPAKEEPAPVAVEAVEIEDPVEPENPPATGSITDKLLEEGGYVKPEANPWQYRTDFFA
jgi:hypothetical protein